MERGERSGGKKKGVRREEANDLPGHHQHKLNNEPTSKQAKQRNDGCIHKAHTSWVFVDCSKGSSLVWKRSKMREPWHSSTSSFVHSNTTCTLKIECFMLVSSVFDAWWWGGVMRGLFHLFHLFHLFPPFHPFHLSQTITSHVQLLPAGLSSGNVVKGKLQQLLL